MLHTEKIEKAKKIEGVIVPMVTPLDENFRIDEKGVTNIIQHFIANGVHPFVLGTTGESMSIPEEDKDTLVKLTVLYSEGRVKTYAGISSNCMKDALTKAEKYAKYGVDFLVAHLPWYFPINPNGMIRWFTEMANNIPLPLILYNNPYTTYVSIPHEVTEELSYHPNIIGIKDSERGTERLNKSIFLWKDREDFSFLIGWAAQSAYAVLNGADGIVPGLANLFPDIYKKIFDEAKKGNKDEAFKYQKIADEISEITQKNRDLSGSIAVLKIMLSVAGLCEPFTMPPIYGINKEESLIIKEKTMKFLKTEFVKSK